MSYKTRKFNSCKCGCRKAALVITKDGKVKFACSRHLGRLTADQKAAAAKYAAL